jgi:3',5'-cyclic AMP phosphodiesterase CpdA
MKNSQESSPRDRRNISVALAFLAAWLTGCAHLAPRPWTFVQLCDPQLGFNGYAADAARFRQAVKQINQLHPDFVVICGDLVDGASEKSYADFKVIKSGFHVPCYCAPGNHDVGNVATPATLQRYRHLVGNDYYAFDHKGCTFVVLNSQLWKSPLPGETEQQEHWLKRTLQRAARRRQPVFIIEHYPLFDAKPEEAENYYNLPPARRRELLELFQHRGVVAVLAGHTHTTIIRQYNGIRMVASGTTSRNFDKRPPGFRIWRVGPPGPCDTRYVPLQDRGGGS